MNREDFNRAYATCESFTEKGLLRIAAWPCSFLIVLAWSAIFFCAGKWL